MKRFQYLIMLIVPIITIYSYSVYANKGAANKMSVATQQEIIDRVLAYPMPHIIARCKKEHHYEDEDMLLLEKELKKYLILAIVHRGAELGNGMYSRDVDNLWHSFLLFTREYAAFCHEYAGFFIHHIPEIEDGRSAEKLLETQQDFLAFIDTYEKTFNQEINPIWLLDISEWS